MVLTSLGTWGLPQMVQKFYAIKSEDAITQGTVISTAFAPHRGGGLLLPGGLRPAVLHPGGRWPEGGYDSIIPAMLSGLPTILIAVVVILGALRPPCPRCPPLVLASSSTLTLDFIKDNLIRDMDEKRQVRWMRALVVVFIAISVVLAIVQYRSNLTFIAQLMGVSWGALAGSFLAPFLYGLYWKRTTKARLCVLLPVLHRGHAGQYLCGGTISPPFSNPPSTPAPSAWWRGW